MSGTNLTIDELRDLSDELIDVRRSLILGRDELRTKNAITANEFEGMGKTWDLINDLFQAIQLRAFNTIASDLSNATARLQDSLRKAEIVIADADDAVKTLKLSVSIFNLIDELLVAFQTAQPAKIAQVIDEIDKLAKPSSTIILPTQPTARVISSPPGSPPPSPSTPPSASANSNLSGQKIIKPVDISKQFYYELTPRRLAILDLIAFTEGTDQEIGNTKKGYNIIFTFATFSDFSKHPRITKCSGSLCSTAAGRYQFLDKTWDSLQRNLSLAGFKPFPNFEPEYQDQAALYLIDWARKAMKDVDSGNLTPFLNKCSWEWASLPIPSTSPSKGRYTGQGVVSETKVKQVYDKLFDLWNT